MTSARPNARDVRSPPTTFLRQNVHGGTRDRDAMIVERRSRITTLVANSTVAGSLVLQAPTEAQLTQRQLAEAAQVPQSTIADIERGRRPPSIPLLQRILRAAGMELRFVLSPLDDHAASLAPDRPRTNGSARCSAGRASLDDRGRGLFARRAGQPRNAQPPRRRVPGRRRLGGRVTGHQAHDADGGTST